LPSGSSRCATHTFAHAREQPVIRCSSLRASMLRPASIRRRTRSSDSPTSSSNGGIREPHVGHNGPRSGGRCALARTSLRLYGFDASISGPCVQLDYAAVQENSKFSWLHAAATTLICTKRSPVSGDLLLSLTALRTGPRAAGHRRPRLQSTPALRRVSHDRNRGRRCDCTFAFPHACLSRRLSQRHQ
jgi:hypothetical protein